MKMLIAVIVAVLLWSCNTMQTDSRARIIERRILEPDRLLIKYSFQAGEELIIDSVTLANTIIPHDSLPVSYDAGNPRRNKLKIP